MIFGNDGSSNLRIVPRLIHSLRNDLYHNVTPYQSPLHFIDEELSEAIYRFYGLWGAISDFKLLEK